MSTLVETMVLVAVMAGGFETVPPIPTVVTAPEAEIRVICGVDKLQFEKLYGCFNPKTPSLIFLSEVEEMNTEAAGSLLHEVVHYVQHHNGRLEPGTDGLYGCALWLAAEMQAFSIEIEWVEQQGGSSDTLKEMAATYPFACAGY